MSKATFNYAQAAKKASSSNANSAAPSPTAASPAPQQAPLQASTSAAAPAPSTSAPAPQQNASKEAAPAMNGGATSAASAPKPTADPAKPAASAASASPASPAPAPAKINFSQFFRGKPGSTPSPAPPESKPQANAAPSSQIPSQSPAPVAAAQAPQAQPTPPSNLSQSVPASSQSRAPSAYSAAVSPRPQNQGVPPPPPPPQFQPVPPAASRPSPALTGNARDFTPGQSIPTNGPQAPTFVPGPAAAQPFKPSQSAGPFQTSFNGGQRGPPPQAQGQNQPRQRFNSQQSPRAPPNGALPPQQQQQQQPNFYNYAQQPPPPQGYYPYPYYPGQQQYPQQGQPPAHIPPPASGGLPSSQGLARSSSAAGSAAASITSPSPVPQGMAPRPSTPSAAGSPPPSQTGSTPLRPFNPSASEFSPGVNPTFYQPRKESKAIQIRRPPSTTPSKAIPIKVPPSKPSSEVSATEDAEKVKQQEAAAAQQKAADEKAQAEKEEKEKAEQETKAKVEEQAKAKAAAEETERKEKEAAAQREREAAEAKERKDKEEAEQKAKEAEEAKQRADKEAAEKQAQEAAEAQKAADAEKASAPTAESSKAAEKPAEQPTEAPKTPAEVTASTNESLRNARPIDNLQSVQYPDTVNSPRPELNQNAEPGKYYYDREFLLQFMNVCKERPDALPSLEAIGMADADGSLFTPAGGHTGNMARTSSYGGSKRSGMPQSRSGSSSGQSRSGFNQPMGSFNSAPAKTSEQRFQQSLQQANSFGPGPAGFGGGRPGAIRQSSMLGGMGMGNIAGTNRRSDRGKRRNDSGRGPAHPPQPQESFDSLRTTANAWTPDVQSKAGPGNQPADPLAPEFVQRKVKALLNKLTVDNFASISDQLLAWANKSEQEKDGRILRQVIALIFEKATDEAAWSEMYARLARKLQDRVSPGVVDETMPAPSGQPPPSGGSLFRKYLLNRCQEDYEKGWSERQRTANAAASQAEEDRAKLESNEASKADAEKAAESGQPAKSEPKEAEILSDEYYAAQKAKRRGLGLVRFIGELYKLDMLTARIMHECIKKLLADVENPEEDDMESLCRLMTTVGKQLEEDPLYQKGQTEKSAALDRAKAFMDVYADRLRQITNNDRVSSRVHFMVLDVLDLRASGWKGRQAPSGPKTIQQIHADARQAEEASRAALARGGSSNRLPSMSQQLPRGGSSGSRGPRGREAGPDGWSSVPQQQQRTAGNAGDLSQFGRIRSQQGTSRFGGPSGAFGNRRTSKQEEPVAEAPRQNSFAALAAQEAAEAESESNAQAEGEQRKPLQLAPRTKPVEGEAQPEQEGMDEEAITRSIDNTIKEYLTLKDAKEAHAAITALPSDARWRAVSKFTGSVITEKKPQVEAAAELFKSSLGASVLSKDDFIKGFGEDIKELLEVSYDAPMAVDFYVLLMKSVDLSKSEVESLSKNIQGEEEEEAEEVREKLLAAF